MASLYRTDLALPKRQATPAQLTALGRALTARRICLACGTEKPYCMPRSTGECNDCAEEGYHDTRRLPAHCPVKKPLTPKRRYRVVENDEYAAFLRRVIRAYSRRVASGDIEAITTMATLADDLEDATRQAITGLRAFGYSWADIAMRLGITRQGAQQRWGDTAPLVTDTSSSPGTGSRP